MFWLVLYVGCNTEFTQDIRHPDSDEKNSHSTDQTKWTKGFNHDLIP